MLLTGLTQHRLVQGWIKLLANHSHRSNTQLFEHLNQLFVEPLIAAVKPLGFFRLRIELLTSTLEIIHNGEDFTEGAADELQLEVVLVATLTLAEVVEVRSDAYILTAQHLMLLSERGVLLLELLKTGVVVNGLSP